VSAIVLSLVGHLALFAAAVVTATVWRPEPTKVYIVNLVPAVAAVGSPSGSAHATPQAPAKSDPAPRATPAAKAPPAETPSAPTLPELPREPVRTRSVHDTPALPDASGSHEPALPASPARLKVPSLPSERPVVGPRDLDRTLPSRLAEVPRERPPRSVRLTSTGDVLARPAPRDVPEVARSLTPPGPLPAPSAPDLARASAPALPRLATLEPSMLAAARPAPTPPKTAAPVAPPSGAVALGAPAASTQGSGPVTVQASDFPFAWYLHAVQRKITEKWAPPTRGDGRALVVFEISRNGEVKRTALEGSSGDAVYDQAALRAIADATPFPPLPEQYKSSILKIHLGFSPVSDRG
jgi:protein TonB